MAGERATMDLPELAGVLGCSRGSIYNLARQNALPVPVIRLGRRMVVSRRSVAALLAAGNENEGGRVHGDDGHA